MSEYVPVEYPKWVAGHIVEDAAEELALLEAMTAPGEEPIVKSPAPELEPAPEPDPGPDLDEAEVDPIEDSITSDSMSGRGRGRARG